jgi:hypothetical protein
MYAAQFAPKMTSPLQRTLDARQRTYAAEQELRNARNAEAVAEAEYAALHLMCSADTVRPPAGGEPR